MSADMQEFIPSEYSMRMFDDELSSDFSVSKRLSILSEGAKVAGNKFKLSADKMYILKDKLIDLVSEMWLEVGGLSENLQTLIRISSPDQDEEFENSNTIKQSRLASQLLEKGISLVENDLLAWQSDLRALGILRAQVCYPKQ